MSILDQIPVPGSRLDEAFRAIEREDRQIERDARDQEAQRAAD